MDLKNKLKEFFGYSEFRGNQEAVIKNLLAGRDTFVIMPTGAGKSMCYQLPATILEGTAIVISPLIALMKNQVDQLNAYNINAAYLNSTLNKTETNRVKAAVKDSRIKLLYVAPESLTKEENIEMLRSANISFVAIDEVHCISEWGHDFRPEYRRIKNIIQQIGDLPIIALTATATPKVQQDIQRNLHMEEADVFKSSFFRTNLYYEVLPKINAKRHLVQFVKEHNGQAGIVYCLSRKKVEELADFLKVNDVKALPYHAGLDSGQRERNQDAFLNEQADVIVATIAFGMGIDKPDVRYVVHYDAPKSLEGYYQETGRAGRDGRNSRCLMFYSYHDILKLEKFNKDKTVTERDNAKMLLEEVTAYAESAACRTRQLLHYFGEHINEDCGNCDNCKNPKETYEGQDQVELVLKTFMQTREKFGLRHAVDVIRGSKNQYVLSYNHDKLEVYGKGKDQDAHFWTSVIRQALILELLVKDIDNYGVIKLTDSGRGFIQNPYPVTLSKDHEYPEVSEQIEEEGDAPVGKSYDKILYGLLKELRKSVATRKNLPPYVIFQDQSLEEMAVAYPSSLEDMTHISGVGMGKAKKFGSEFVNLIKKYVKEHDIQVAHEVFIKSSAKKSKNKILIIQQVDKKIDLHEIAKAQGMEFDNLVEEMEHICHSGTKLNIDYYLDEILDEERQDDIYDYFMEANSDDLEEALEELGDEYTEEEIKLVHIKFISEVAN